jgi:hypothetical protein
MTTIRAAGLRRTMAKVFPSGETSQLAWGLVATMSPTGKSRSVAPRLIRHEGDPASVGRADDEPLGEEVGNQGLDRTPAAVAHDANVAA